jgi:hypothetical protein
MKENNRSDRIVAWIVVGIFAALWLMHCWRTQDHARTYDFLCTYTAAYVTAQGRVADLYDPAVQITEQKGLAAAAGEFVPPDRPPLPFNRPPFYALLLAPLGWLPLRLAFVAWFLAQTGVFVACLAWAVRRFGTPALMLGCMSMPAAMGIANAQDSVFFLAILIGSYSLAKVGREWIAGLVLGLLLVKFHLAPLWPIALILQRRWRMLGGFIATGVVAAGISLAAIGLNGAREYVALLLNHDKAWMPPAPEYMISFEGLAANLGITSILFSGVIAIAIIAAFLTALYRAPLWRTFAATTVASLLLGECPGFR